MALRVQVEIDGASMGDLYRRLRWIAEETGREEREGEGTYVTGFGDGPEMPYFFRVVELED
jgi:hypothetical protein